MHWTVGDGSMNSGSPNSTSSTQENLIAPCKCTGTVALIHLSCLEHWLTASNTDRCEICQFMYKTTRVPRTCNEVIPSSILCTILHSSSLVSVRLNLCGALRIPSTKRISKPIKPFDRKTEYKDLFATCQVLNTIG